MYFPAFRGVLKETMGIRILEEVVFEYTERDNLTLLYLRVANEVDRLLSSFHLLCTNDRPAYAYAPPSIIAIRTAIFFERAMNDKRQIYRCKSQAQVSPSA